MFIRVRAQCMAVFLMASFIVLMLSGLGTRMMAQTITATITGTVTDQSGASVPSATVTATGESTGFTRSTVTSEDGRFTLSQLPMGTYTVTAEKTGFKKYQRAGFGPLGAAQVARLDIAMVLGAIVETMQVTGAAPVLQTQTSVVRTPIYSDQIESLPLVNRSPVALLLQQPGAQISQQAAGSATGQYLGFNFNGLNAGGNNFSMDGTDASVVADNTLTINGGNLVTASVDSIAEFDTGSSNYSAEVKGSGGYVNILTKSGTNKFHGDVFEFLRNDVLDSRSFFATDTEKLRLNDFGGTVAGPIRRDKTFFLGSWEGQRIRRPTTTVLVVPTAAFRSTVDPRLSQQLDLTPLPTQPVAGNADVGYFTSAPSESTRQDLVTGRIDHVFSGKDSFFGRYTINSLGDSTPSPYIGFSTFEHCRHQYMTLSETHVFSPTLLNTVKLGMDRFDQYGKYGRQNATDFGLDAFSVPGMDIAGGETYLEFPHTGASINDELTWNKGKHSLKFGGLYFGTLYGRVQFAAYTWGFVTPQAFALDQPAWVYSYFGPGKSLIGNHYSDTQQGFYVQDDFHATPNLTLNLGLRYDNFGVMKESRNRMVNVVRDPLGPFRDPTQPIYERNNLDFGPRIGFAWQPLGQKRLAVRGGYGVFWAGPGSLEAPVLYQLNLIDTFVVLSADNPNLAYPLNAAAVQGILYSPGRYVVDPYAPDMYAQQWSLATEYQASDSTTVRAAYVGNHGVHVYGTDEPNAWDPLLGHRPNPNLGTVYEQIRRDSTLYDAMELSYRRRFSRGLGLDVHYTWSHAIGVESGARELSAGAGLGDEQIQSLMRRGLSRGNLPFDQRHALTLDYHYAFPQVNLSSGPARKLVNGWGVSGIATITSGLPFNVYTGGDAGDYRYAQRPNIVPGLAPTINGVSPADGMLNLAAFAVPTTVDPLTGLRLGDMGNNMLRTRRRFTTDFALIKTTRIREALDLQFRAEFFNLTNHPNFSAPYADMMVPSLFGMSLSTAGAREGQLALKFLF